MFRITKSDDLLRRREPSKRADLSKEPSSEDAETPDPPAASSVESRRSSNKALETKSATDDSVPSDANRKPDAAAGDDGPTHRRVTESSTLPDGAAIASSFSALFDEDDDIDDFDELGFVESIIPPLPAPTFNAIPAAELKDVSSPDDDDDLLLADADGFGDDLIQERTPAPKPDGDAKPADHSPLPTEKKEPETVDGNLEAPATASETAAAQTGNGDTGADDPADEDPLPELTLNAKLEDDEDPETPSALSATRLSLQPIPEFQSQAASAEAKGAKSKTGKRGQDDTGVSQEKDEDIVSLFRRRLENGDFDDGEPSPPEAPTDSEWLDDDSLSIPLTDAELLDASSPGAGDDWHAELADALSDSAEPQPSPATETRDDEPATVPKAAADPPAVPLKPRKETSAPKTPKSLGKLEKTEETAAQPEIVRPSQRKAPAPLPPPARAKSVADLSSEQLSISIIAATPRLRRFAAALVGDEAAADRLTQGTCEAAFANSATLEAAGDVGLGLLTLLLRRREDMLLDPRAIPRPPESARAFETMLCHGLIGADQFEIYEFARAINGLEERERGLLLLSALEGLNYAQIADVLRRPTDRVMVDVAAARTKLRQALARESSDIAAPSAALSSGQVHMVEIHGYLDGELDEDRMADVDALVEQNETVADELLHFGIQGDLIRRLYAPLLGQPLPGVLLDTLAAATSKPARRTFRFGSKPRKTLIAGAALIALLGAAAAWPYFTEPSPTTAVVYDSRPMSTAAIE